MVTPRPSDTHSLDRPVHQTLPRLALGTSGEYSWVFVFSIPNEGKPRGGVQGRSLDVLYHDRHYDGAMRGNHSNCTTIRKLRNGGKITGIPRYLGICESRNASPEIKQPTQDDQHITVFHPRARVEKRVLLIRRDAPSMTVD